MLVVFNANGELLKLTPTQVNQGSNLANRLTVIAPISSVAVCQARFTLPNGVTTKPVIVPISQNSGYLGLQDENGNQVFVWEYDIPTAITSFAGNVTTQLTFSTTTQLTLPPTTQTIATFSFSFSVLQGVPTISVEEIDSYDDIISALQSLNISISNNIINLQGQIDTLDDEKQDKYDGSLETTEKYVVKAINELNEEIENIETFNSSITEALDQKVNKVENVGNKPAVYTAPPSSTSVVLTPINDTELAPSKGDIIQAEEGGAVLVGNATKNFHAVNLGQLDEAIASIESVAKGASSAIVRDNYQQMVNFLNNLDPENTEIGVGTNVLIREVKVPDLWISEIRDYSVEYTFTTNADLIAQLQQTQTVQIGYFVLSELETQNINVDAFATKESLDAVEEEVDELRGAIVDDIAVLRSVESDDSISISLNNWLKGSAVQIVRVVGYTIAQGEEGSNPVFVANNFSGLTATGNGVSYDWNFPEISTPLGTVIDFENKVIKNSGREFSFNGTEGWQLNSDGTGVTLQLLTSEDNASDIVITDSNFGNYSLSAGVFSWYTVLTKTGYTLDEFKSWLAERYANGTPVSIRASIPNLEEITPFNEEQLAVSTSLNIPIDAENIYADQFYGTFVVKFWIKSPRTRVIVNGEFVEEWNADTKIDKKTDVTNAIEIYAKDKNGNLIMIPAGAYNSNTNFNAGALGSRLLMVEWGQPIYVGTPNADSNENRAATTRWVRNYAGVWGDGDGTTDILSGLDRTKTYILETTGTATLTITESIELAPSTVTSIRAELRVVYESNKWYIRGLIFNTSNDSIVPSQINYSTIQTTINGIYKLTQVN